MGWDPVNKRFTDASVQAYGDQPLHRAVKATPPRERVPLGERALRSAATEMGVDPDQLVLHSPAMKPSQPENAFHDDLVSQGGFDRDGFDFRAYEPDGAKTGLAVATHRDATTGKIPAFAYHVTNPILEDRGGAETKGFSRKPDKIRRQVLAALSNAAANGHPVHRQDPAEAAQDLTSYGSDLEGHDADDLVPHVKEWQEKQKEKRDGKAKAMSSKAGSQRARRVSEDGGESAAAVSISPQQASNHLGRGRPPAKAFVEQFRDASGLRDDTEEPQGGKWMGHLLVKARKGEEYPDLVDRVHQTLLDNGFSHEAHSPPYRNGQHHENYYENGEHGVSVSVYAPDDVIPPVAAFPRLSMNVYRANKNSVVPGRTHVETPNGGWELAS